MNGIWLSSVVGRFTAGLGGTFLLAFASLGAGEARAAVYTYSYSILAQSGDIIGGSSLGLIRDVALNNSGQVAFIADTAGGHGLFTTTSRLAKTGDTIGGTTLGSLESTDINDSGQVVFSSGIAPGTLGVFTPSSRIAVPGDTLGGNTLNQIVSNSNINNAGTITFMGRSNTPGVSTPGIYTQNSLIHQQIGMPAGRNSLNNNGVVAFESGPIHTHDGLSLSTVGTYGDVIGGIKWGSTFFPGGAGTTIGDNGLVGWVGNGVDPVTNLVIGNTLFTPGRVVAKKGDIVGGRQISNLFYGTSGVDIAINGSGEVAYRARLETSSKTGVFVEQSKVAATGETILGKSVGGVGRLDMNDAGQILFAANLDGASSLILATPLPSGGFIFNGDFQIPALAGWTPSGLGSALAIEVPLGSGNLVAQLTAGSEEILSQSINTPALPYWFSYDYLFPSTDGLLQVLLNSLLIDSIAAPSSVQSDFITRRFLVDDPALLGLGDVALAFRFNGLTGSQVLLDNVSISPIPEPTTFVIWFVLAALGISVGWWRPVRR